MKRVFWREPGTEVYLFEVFVCFLLMGLTLMLTCLCWRETSGSFILILLLKQLEVLVQHIAHICISSLRFYVQQKYVVGKVTSHHSRLCEFRSGLLLVCGPDL